MNLSEHLSHILLKSKTNVLMSCRKGKEGIRMFAKVELERALLSQGLSYCYRILRKSSENTSNGKEIFLQPFYPYDGCIKLTVSPDLGNIFFNHFTNIILSKSTENK